MRLIERTLREISIAPRMERIGSLGGRAEGFSEEMTTVRGAVLPESGALSTGEKGLHSGAAIRLLVPADAQVKIGDGAWVEGSMYIVSAVRRWTGHLELECEARA
ncbi:MAG: hypothetical protein IJ466_12570 [Clostridia bacterium]|nr:hypothetical protein [Clostridia bacterium]